MINKKSNKKAQQFGAFLAVLAIIISVFAVGLYSGNSNSATYNNQDNENKITGNAVGMERVTGF